MKKLMMLLIAMINIFAFTSCNNEVADGSSTDESKNFERGWYTYTVTHDDEVKTKYYFLYNKKKQCIRMCTDEEDLQHNNLVDRDNLKAWDYDTTLRTVCDFIKLEKTPKTVLDELSWYIEPTFVEDDIVFKAGWWEFSSTVDGEKDEVAGYFYFDLDKNLLKAFFDNYGEYEQADEEFLTQFAWDSMLENNYWEPYYGGDNHIIDQYLRKVSEEDLPEFIKNSL
ncbi:MAG: hypothetical protein IIW71_05425 [Treponema sp.]|nr:hypothetical protein [Treponema sp.]